MLRIALVGAAGVIARDQHIPALLNSSEFRLMATVDPSQGDSIVSGVPHYQSVEEMLRSEPAITAVSVATPTSTHYRIVRELLLAGKDVLVEKPPTVTMEELEELERTAKENKRILMTGYHSKHNPSVQVAKEMLVGDTIIGGSVEWLECFAHYHRGQTFCWKKGGAGVFDPGINALAILLELTQNRALNVTEAQFGYPKGAEEPGIVKMKLMLPDQSGELDVRFDWMRKANEPDLWNISLETRSGRRFLIEYVHSLKVDGKVVKTSAYEEYPLMYEYFRSCILQRTSFVSKEELSMIDQAEEIASCVDLDEEVKLDLDPNEPLVQLVKSK